MNNFLETHEPYHDGYYKSKNDETFAEAFVREVRNDLIDVSRSFFKIGFRLNEAQQESYYKELGYETLTDLAEDLFGFKKSTTYGLIQVWEFAHDENSPMSMQEKYLQYSYSQLLEISKSIPYHGKYINYISPSDSVKEIRDFTKLWNAGKINGDKSYKSVKEYFENYDRASGLPLLGGRSDIEENFQISGQPVPVENAVETETAIPTPENQNYIKEALLYGSPFAEGKYRIYFKYFDVKGDFYEAGFPSSAALKEFCEYLKSEYGNGGFYNGRVSADFSASKGFTVEVRDSNFIKSLTWTEVAHKIAWLIDGAEYFSDEEQAYYTKNYLKDKERQPDSAESAFEFFQTSGKSLPAESKQEALESCPEEMTIRQHLENLSTEDFAEQLCTQIYIFTEFLSQRRIEMAMPKIIEWLNTPYKELK